MMEITYRKMHSNDHSAATALWRSLPGMGLSGADAKAEIEKFLKKNPETCWVAEWGDSLAGTILGGSDGRRGYIYHLAVREDLQKRGIGNGLLTRCLDAFRAAGIQKCHLLVYHDNLAGIAFWEHASWKLREDVLIMSKDLEY
mgnify:CR=1 FL=1